MYQKHICNVKQLDNFCRQSIVLLSTTKNKETKHHIHPKRKRETEITAPANKINYSLILYTFYNLRFMARKQSRSYSYNPRACRRLKCSEVFQLNFADVAVVMRMDRLVPGVDSVLYSTLVPGASDKLRE